MADKAHQWTDEKIAELERRIEEIYSEAKSDLEEKWKKYMEQKKPKIDSLYNDYVNAMKTGTREEQKVAFEKYQKQLEEFTVKSKRFEEMVDQTTEKLANVNQIVVDYVNGELPETYVKNYNYIGQQAENDVSGYSFTIVDEDTVKSMIVDDPLLLPQKTLDIAKDKRWNKKLLNSQVLQGILQGESIPDIANRIQNVESMNRVAAVRTARTMTTSAENKGRMDSFERMEKDGLIMKKEWIATKDERTRAWHSALDGVTKNPDEPFENDYGKIMFPGDPSADPANVYNCRCTLGYKFIGYNHENRE